MTWIDVANDAVKIGLGAVVGGVLALLSARQAHHHRVSEEYSRRRRDHLEKVMAEFDPLALSIMAHAMVLYQKSQAENKGDEVDEALETAKKKGRVKDMSFIECQQALNPLEAKLALMDFPDVARDIDGFRMAAFELEPNAKSLKPDELGPLVIALEKKRHAVMAKLAQCYKEA